jgi:succinyl-diaminopimelate desuccinylase
VTDPDAVANRGRLGRSDPEAVDLLARTATLVDIPSVSHGESALADHVEAELGAAPGLEVRRIGDNVVARTALGRPARLVLAGHLDTVPPNGNEVTRIEGDVLRGLGSADMKGGLAVMLALAAAVPEPVVDVTYVFYVCEEVDRRDNGLLQIDAVDPGLLAGDAAILGEPTGGRIEAGCQGVIKLEINLAGTRAHTARPWMGVNAVHRLAPVLSALGGYEARRPVIDGCEYREALQAVAVSGGVAGNVVPDRATVVVSHRFAPDRDAAEAIAHLEALLEPRLDTGAGDSVRVVEAQPAAAPGLTHPLLAALLASVGQPPRAKLGWTDVAFFAERGVPAANFGPGDPAVAHTAGEEVHRDELDRVFVALRELLTA